MATNSASKETVCVHFVFRWPAALEVFAVSSTAQVPHPLDGSPWSVANIGSKEVAVHIAFPWSSPSAYECPGHPALVTAIFLQSRDTCRKSMAFGFYFLQFFLLWPRLSYPPPPGCLHALCAPTVSAGADLDIMLSLWRIKKSRFSVSSLLPFDGSVYCFQVVFVISHPWFELLYRVVKILNHPAIGFQNRWRILVVCSVYFYTFELFLMSFFFFKWSVKWPCFVAVYF